MTIKPGWQSPWLDAAALARQRDAARIATIATRVLADPAWAGEHCVWCGAEQPHGVRWPAYALAVQRIATRQTLGEIGYRACPTCEPLVDTALQEDV